MKRIALFALLIAVPLLMLAQQTAPAKTPAPVKAQPTAPAKTAPAAKTVQKTAPVVDKHEITGTDNYYTYRWTKKAVKGVNTLVVAVFDKANKPVKNLTVSASVYQGPQATPVKALTLNKKGHYTMPVNFTATGDWQISISIAKDGKELCNNTYTQKI